MVDSVRGVRVSILSVMLGLIAIGLVGATGSIAQGADQPAASEAISHSLLASRHTPPVGQQVVGRVFGGQRGWRVQAISSVGRLVAETVVEETDRYSLPPLVPGVYQVVVRKMDGGRVGVTAGDMLRVGTQLTDQPRTQVVVVDSTDKYSPAVVQANGTISGVITAADTGLPVQSIISIYTAAGQYQSGGYNDAVTGVYSVSVPPGDYKIWFYPFDTYVPEYYNNQSSLANANLVTVNDGAVTPNINAVVDIGGWITGTVTADTGSAPLQSISIHVYTSTTSLNDIRSAGTDFAGNYQIGQLPTGIYALCFSVPSDQNYLGECYDDQVTLASADAVAVTSGMTTSVSAGLATGGQIMGNITDAGNGDPLGSVYVYAYTGTTSVNYVASDYTNGNGDYTLNGLPTGNYYLKFDPQYDSEYLEEFYNDKPSLALANPVTVTAGSATSGIDAALATGGRILGRVTAVTGGGPIGDMSVRVYTSTSTYPNQYLQTDAAGYYTVTTLPTGNYYLEFVPPYATEYLPEFYNDKSTLAQANPVTATAGMTTTNINVALVTGGRITGHVTAVVGGGPIASVGVYAYTSTTSVNSMAFAATDAAGHYTVTKLPTGNYYLKFNPASNYLTEYYNDKPDLASANPVAVTVGSTTGNINAALSSPGSIVGTVTAVDGGAPLQNVYVSLYERDNCDETSWVKSAYTNAAGNYTLSNVAPGEYVVYFDTRYGPKLYLPEYYNDKSEEWLADPITVTVGQNVSNINAALQRGGYISGQVTAADGGAPLANISVTVYDSQGRYKGGVSTNASGHYTTTALLSGAYRLRFSPQSNGAAAAYLTEYYNNKVNLTVADPISVTVGNATPNINAVLDRGGRISGRVTGTGNIPLEGVQVWVYDATGNSLGQGSTNSSGYYTTTGVVAGSYHIQFDTEYAYGTAEDYGSEYYNDKATLAASDPVAVIGTSVTTGINATLALGGRISGKTTVHGTGLPLPDTYVEVYGADDRYVGSSNSDSQGNYTTNVLASGTYRVRFWDTWRYNPATCNYDRYYGVYYNQKPTLAAADLVTVTVPSTSINIDAVLALTPSGLTNKVYVPLIRR